MTIKERRRALKCQRNILVAEESFGREGGPREVKGSVTWKVSN